jgi:GntR family transcriptional regulator/MocR family aminotransferase
MSSPVDKPIQSILQVDRLSDIPVYIQIARKMIQAIQRGTLSAGVKLPSTRALADMLQIHRKTAVAAYQEVDAQGWIEILPNKGTFVSKKSLVLKAESLLTAQAKEPTYPQKAGFAFQESMLLDRQLHIRPSNLAFTDGLPDVRLAPWDKISKAFSSVLKRKNNTRNLVFSHVEGNVYFRDQLSDYLNDTRGIPIGAENILTTRGIQMGIYLACSVLLQSRDNVIVGNLSYYVSNMIFQQAGARIQSVPVDEEGICVEAVEELCKKMKIRMLYLTPHHHYPTTVTLSAARRVALLNLAVQYGFVILEDDYDYDFHYESSPVLPLASADVSGMVVYIGSFCKALAPGLRTGYIVAPQNFIAELAKHRRIIDRQGDLSMEQALGEMLAEGEIQRHLKKAQKIYHSRRDLLCEILSTQFEGIVQYRKPNGGLAIWTEWGKEINLLKLSRNCQKKNLYLPQTLLFQNEQVRAIRLGFGNMTESEMGQAISILKESIP